MKEYPIHPFANIFPLHDGAPLYEMRGSIKEIGLQDPIVLYKGAILDGRRRYKACVSLEIEPAFVLFQGDDEDALSFVLAKNLHRRHLGEAERAMVAAQIAKMKRGGAHGNQFSKSENGHSASVGGATTKNGKGAPAPLATIGEVAEMLNVSEGAVDRAKKVTDKGTKSLQNAVNDGTLTLSDAAAVAGEPAKVQNEAVKKVRKKRTKTAKKAVEEIKQDETEEPKEPCDDNEVPWKTKSTKAMKAIEAIPDLKEMSRTLAGIIKKLEDGEHLRLYTISLQSVIATIKSVKESLLGACPAYVCPYCDGTGKTLEGAQQGKRCEVCEQNGWVTKSVYKRSPKGQEAKK